MINKEDIEKLKKHCENQIKLNEMFSVYYPFNDLKTAREHKTVLALIEENEQLKEASKAILRANSATYGLDTKCSEDRWSMFRTHIKKCLDDLEVARYDISADEYIDTKHVLEGVLAKMDELEKLYD